MSRRSLAILLAVSVALNLFMIGAAAGSWWMRERMEIRRTPVAPALGWRAIGRRLSPDGRQTFRKALREIAPETAPLAADGRRHRAAAADLMAAPMLDPAALGVALQGARTADLELRRRLESAVVEAATELSPADRQVLAENLRRRAQRPSRRPSQDKSTSSAPERAAPPV